VDPLYDKLHPNPPQNFQKRDWLRGAKATQNDGIFLERTFNWYKDARKFCPGVLSASGYYLLNDSESAVMDADDFPVERNRPGYQDWYFFAYGKDYKQALSDFRLLSGPSPLLPHKNLGIIFSRWPAFTEVEIETMARDFAANGYPLSTLVMDMEWHKEGWGHWEFSPALIPDPKRFFALCRKHGLDVTFNDHPLDVRDDDVHYEEYVKQAGPSVEIREREYNGKKLKMAKVDICDKQQNRAFRAVCHTHILDLGLDYWWNDGSRGQMSGTAGQLVCNKTFFEESEGGQPGSRPGATSPAAKRGMLLARYGGLGSHRYGGFFTGDATSDYDVLRLQCEFNIRAGGVGLSNISHDIGGFCLAPSQVKKNKAGVEVIDAERYLRWLQFGVFNPILRFHSAPGCGSRRPDDYDVELDGACRHWLRIRHSLLPYLYTAMRHHHETGIPVTRGMFLEEPENPEAYRFDQFYFGADMLVAPVLSAIHKRTVYLPAGEWWEFETAKRVSGGVEITRPVGLNEVPVYVKAGSIIPRQDPDGAIHAGHIGDLVLDVYPNSRAGATSPAAGPGNGLEPAVPAGSATLYEDDGISPAYRDGAFCRTQFDLTDGSLTSRLVEGKPLGAKRRITVVVASETPLAPAMLNGKTKIVSEPCGTNRYRFVLPELPAAVSWELKLKV
jgi:alpha-glucosidase (family GH31 glycosyl hydrolase)